MNNRIELALEFLKDGKPFSVGDLNFEIENNIFTVIGWSIYLNFVNLTKGTSITELSEIKTIFSNMLGVSKNLRSFVADKEIEYKLCFDDGGKTSIDICTEKNGVIKWFVNLK